MAKSLMTGNEERKFMALDEGSLAKQQPDLAKQFMEVWLQTAAWCSVKASVEEPAKSIRTSTLMPSGLTPERPSLLGDELWKYIPIVCVRRREILSAVAHDNFERPTVTDHTLVFQPDLTISDGIAEEHSLGYFDVYNCPGWDTWVWYASPVDPLATQGGPILFCYVPPVLRHFADNGIRVNPEGSIDWISSKRYADNPVVQFVLRMTDRKRWK